MYIVYMIINDVNGKAYIGFTSRSLKMRWQEHCQRALYSNSRKNRLYVAMRKYGAEHFRIMELERYEDEEMARWAETKYIKYLNCYDNGYNCNYGGCGTVNPSEEVRKKISESQKGKIIPIEDRIKMSAAKLGDPRCAKNLGEYAKKGAASPRSKTYEIQFPDGHVEIITGLRAFCRQYKLNMPKLYHGTKGYSILRTFDGHPEKEYTQVGGSGGCPSD